MSCIQQRRSFIGAKRLVEIDIRYVVPERTCRCTMCQMRMKYVETQVDLETQLGVIEQEI